jgi:hypothetical protein
MVGDQPRQSLLAEGADMTGAIERMEGNRRRPVTCGVGWGWQASNLRPSDYESLALTD